MNVDSDLSPTSAPRPDLPVSLVLVDRTGLPSGVTPSNDDQAAFEGDKTEQEKPEPPSQWKGLRRYAQSRWTVLAVLFGVTGFLGLPLLWWCDEFSELQRWLIAFINIIYTLALIGLVGLIMVWAFSAIMAA